MRTVLLCLVGFLFAGAAPDAKSPPVGGPRPKPDLCMEDIDKFCKGKEATQVPDCLRKSLEKLSAPCRGKIKNPPAWTGGAPSAVKPKGACATFAAQVCKEGSMEELGACLKQHEAKAPAACRAEMNKPFSGQKAAKPPAKPKGSCAQYVDQLCQGREPAQINECLTLNEGKVSEACRAEMNKPFTGKVPKASGPCGEYVNQFCREKGPTQIADCLRKNRDKVSIACRKEMLKSSAGGVRG